MTKSFLEPLKTNQNVSVENLVREEFISGILNESQQRTKDEEELSNLAKTMPELYHTKDSQMFVRTSTQNCSDLIVDVGEFS
jgi:hypothetical protein